VKIVVTVPTWNEIENIAALAQEILRQDPRIEVLVADDNSPDGTWQAVAALAEREPRVHLLHRTTDKGRGRAGRAAFTWALQHSADFAFEMDADWSHHPRYLPAMIAALVFGPILWLGAMLLTAWLLDRTNAIELGLLITAACFVFAAVVLSVLRLGRRREERRYADRA